MAFFAVENYPRTTVAIGGVTAAGISSGVLIGLIAFNGNNIGLGAGMLGMAVCFAVVALDLFLSLRRNQRAAPNPADGLGLFTGSGALAGGMMGVSGALEFTGLATLGIAFMAIGGFAILLCLIVTHRQYRHAAIAHEPIAMQAQ